MSLFHNVPWEQTWEEYQGQGQKPAISCGAVIKCFLYLPNQNFNKLQKKTFAWCRPVGTQICSSFRMQKSSRCCFPRESLSSDQLQMTCSLPIRKHIWVGRYTVTRPFVVYSWRFSCYSAPIHWLVHGHMTSNNETVSCQMPRAGNISKTMTSNGKQFTVTREMLTAVARDQRWPDVVAGISARF